MSRDQTQFPVGFETRNINELGRYSQQITAGIQNNILVDDQQPDEIMEDQNETKYSTQHQQILQF